MYFKFLTKLYNVLLPAHVFVFKIESSSFLYTLIYEESIEDAFTMSFFFYIIHCKEDIATSTTIFTLFYYKASRDYV